MDQDRGSEGAVRRQAARDIGIIENMGWCEGKRPILCLGWVGSHSSMSII